MLPEKFTEPAGFYWGNFIAPTGVLIRYGHNAPQGEIKGTIALLPGFREPIEKYFEVLRDLTAAGFAVWIMDWQGQGGSARFLKGHPQRMHGQPYEKHIATLHLFATKVIEKPDAPLFLVAHSMGAHIGLRCLQEHPGVFAAAALTAPMFDIRTPGFLKPVARLLVRCARALRLLENYVPRGRDWSEADNVFAGNPRTSDAERFGVVAEIYRARPELKMGQATYGWVLHAFESIKILNDADYLRSIQTPVLMGIAGDDSIVEQAASRRACGLLPHCTVVDIPAAKHEIWMERDELRKPWLARVVGFLNGYL